MPGARGRAVAQPFRKSAIEVLSDGYRLLTAAEIVEKAVQRGLLDPGQTTRAPERIMKAVLSGDMRRRGPDSEFVRRGERFGLDPERHPGARGCAGRPTSNAPSRILFNGRAGEHSVASELLFYGFDARVAAVDAETDVFAAKGGRRFLFQVKTSVPVRDKCSFFIPPGAHEKFGLPGAYYAFVARSGACNDFLVMPHSEVQKHVESGRIARMSRKYRASFVWGERITLGGADVTHYRRRWPEA